METSELWQSEYWFTFFHWSTYLSFLFCYQFGLVGLVFMPYQPLWLFNTKSSLYLYTGWNDKIVALEKTTWFHFPLMKTGFLFFFSFFVADHLLVGQLCTSVKSDRSLLSCLKVTQCSTSKIGDAPLYNSSSLPIRVMTTGPLPAPSKCKSGLPRITGTCLA